MKILLLISALLFSGCITQKDLAGVIKDTAIHHKQEEIILKVEQNTQTLLNDQVRQTMMWFTRLECTVKAKQVALTIYNCDGYALKVTNSSRVEMPLEVVADNKSLTIIALKAL